MSNFILSNNTADRLKIGVFKCRAALDGKFSAYNKSFLKILGLSSGRSLSHKILADIFSNDKEARDFVKALKKQGTVKFYHLILPPRKGKVQWAAISACLVKEGRTFFIEGFLEDITVQMAEREKAAREMDFLQNFLDQMPDAIYFKDKKHRLTKVNRFYARGFGRKPEELIGKTDFDFFPDEQAEDMLKDDNAVLKTGTPLIGKIERTLLPNGTWNQVITTKVPMYDRKGKIIGTMGVTRDMTEHANLEEDRLSMLMNALAVLGKALEMRDPYTFRHTSQVARISEIVGKELGFDKNRLIGLKLAAELHDLGKITIPLDMLTKPGKLTKNEYRLIQEHVEKCYELIKDIRFPFPLAEIVYQHHERLDGSGYPRGLKEKKILLEARILAVGDVLEAMTNHRPYRAALGIKKAVEELKEGSGKRYDKNVVAAALKLIRKNGQKAFWN